METGENYKLLLESKQYVSGTVTHENPGTYVEKFKKALGNVEVKSIDVKLGNPVKIGESEIEHIAYPRYSIEARVGAKDIPIGDEMFINVIGIVVAMDLMSPKVKIYTGMNAKSCLNLNIYNASDIYEENLMSRSLYSWNILNGFAINHEEKVKRYKETVETMYSRKLYRNDVYKILGSLLMDTSPAKEKVQPSIITAAAKSMADTNSRYHFLEHTSAFNVLNAMTQGITDSPDILYKPNKTLALCEKLYNISEEFVRKEVTLPAIENINSETID